MGKRMQFAINNYKARKIDDNYFLTTDHGSHCVLTDDEFKKFRKGDIDQALKNKLEEREIILTKANINEVERLLKNRNSFLFYGTSLHIMIMTLRCDMNCIYCHASSEAQDESGYDMDIATAEKTVDFIFQTPSPSITIEFQGGEPLLNWNTMKHVIEYAKEKNKTAKKTMTITLVSNLTNMDDEKMKYLIDNEVDICTSLDGPKEVHDYNRKFSKGSSYDIVVDWINKINEEYKKRNIKRQVNALLTVTRKSLGSAKEIVDQYVELGIPAIHIRYLNNLGVAKKAWHNINYTIDEFLKFWEEAADYITELQKQGIRINERMVTLMSKKIGDEYDPNYLELRSPCGAAIGQLTYNHNGDIYTCDEARMIGDDIFRLGNVENTKYNQAVTCEKACQTVAASINDQYICAACSYKPYCGICPVCNYSESGSLIAPISNTDRCKIAMKQFDWVVRERFINDENKIV